MRAQKRDGGFYKLFCYWAETGYEKTPEEIAALVR